LPLLAREVFKIHPKVSTMVVKPGDAAQWRHCKRPRRHWQRQ
jgi:hypothetical protein